MALWYDCGSGLIKSVGFARSDLGADLYLCCPGPSLKDVDPESLKVPGAYVMAVNTAYPRIRPDMWIGMDTPYCYDPRLWWEPFVKVARSPYTKETCGGVPIRQLPNVYFADVERAYVTDVFRRRGHHANFVWNGNTFIVAMHIAVWMGARKIHLVGCDFGGRTDYHDARKMTGGQRSNNRKLYNRLVSLLPRLRDTAKLNQIEIVSCTPNSAANVHLEYVPLEEALKKSAERVPSHLGHEVLHAEHARMCRWQRDTVPSGDGLLTGADANQEWLLPWWYENVRKHNECPVAFADFGLSPELRAWCSERGLVLEVPEVPGLTWHKKPFAILASPFKRTVWLDADCEVRGELGVVFPYADKGIGLTLDPHSKTCRQPGALATGVVACAHGEPGIEEWCKEILLCQYRGDQEAFDAIRDRLSARVTVMPRGFQWLRLDEENEDVLVMHWTGGIGKRQIQIKDQLPALA